MSRHALGVRLRQGEQRASLAELFPCSVMAEVNTGPELEAWKVDMSLSRYMHLASVPDRMYEKEW